MQRNDEDPLFQAALALSKCDDPGVIHDFLLSWFTAREVHDMDSRWKLVQDLMKGHSQRRIAQDLGVSLCKITRGSKELKKADSAFKKMLDLAGGA